jgi:hypothetical protein
MLISLLRLTADSRLEIAFVGHPVGFQTPSYKVYKYEPSEALSVVFEVEVRLIRRDISQVTSKTKLRLKVLITFRSICLITRTLELRVQKVSMQYPDQVGGKIEIV